MENGICKRSDLILNVRTKAPRRFKAGSELSSKVNLVDVDINESVDEHDEIKEIKLTFTSEACSSTSESEE